MKPIARRSLLRYFAAAAPLFTVRGAFAEELSRPKFSPTSPVEEGPFYPPRLPLDTDNDLLILNDSITPAVGEITHLSGRLLDASGNPIRNATIEIWQTDHQGIYLADRSAASRFDANFQGFGRFLTASTGEYYFRTIKPVVYPGRQAPHVHFKVKIKGAQEWTTQLFIQGHPGNERDGVWSGLKGAARHSVTVDFKPVPGSRFGELSARFDICLGTTPTDGPHV